MPQMRVALAANRLRARHPVARIPLHLHILRRHRLVITRPSRTRMIFRLRRKQRLPAANAHVRPRRLRILILARTRRLRPLLPRHIILVVIQLRPPLRIALPYFFAHPYILSEIAATKSSPTSARGKESRGTACRARFYYPALSPCSLIAHVLSPRALQPNSSAILIK